jgi:hypothetical protein
VEAARLDEGAALHGPKPIAPSPVGLSSYRLNPGSHTVNLRRARAPMFGSGFSNFAALIRLIRAMIKV